MRFCKVFAAGALMAVALMVGGCQQAASNNPTTPNIPSVTPDISSAPSAIQTKANSAAAAAMAGLSAGFYPTADGTPKTFKDPTVAGTPYTGISGTATRTLSGTPATLSTFNITVLFSNYVYNGITINGTASLSGTSDSATSIGSIAGSGDLAMTVSSAGVVSFNWILSQTSSTHGSFSGTQTVDGIKYNYNLTY